MGVRIPGEGRDTEEVRGRPVGEVDVDEVSVVEAELLLVLVQTHVDPVTYDTTDVTTLSNNHNSVCNLHVQCTYTIHVYDCVLNIHFDILYSCCSNGTTIAAVVN